MSDEFHSCQSLAWISKCLLFSLLGFKIKILSLHFWFRLEFWVQFWLKDIIYGSNVDLKNMILGRTAGVVRNLSFWDAGLWGWLEGGNNCGGHYWQPQHPLSLRYLWGQWLGVADSQLYAEGIKPKACCCWISSSLRAWSKVLPLPCSVQPLALTYYCGCDVRIKLA